MLCFALLAVTPVQAQNKPAETPESDGGADVLDAKMEMDLFYQALKQAREGNIEEARTMLDRIIEKQPPGAFQDDAYYEMARISDEMEHKYSDAVKRYELMAERFPNARPARRALRRAEYLKKAISSGEERFARYEAIMKSTGKDVDHIKQIAEVKEILKGDTPFALEWDALLWMAVKYRSLNDCAEAVEVYEQMEEKAVDSNKKREALIGRADCLLTMGNIYKARTLFETLAKTEGFGQETARNKLLDMNQDAVRLYIRYASIAALVIMLMLLIVMLFKKSFRKPDSFKPPFELLFLLPIFLSAFIVALQKGKFAWQAVGLVVLIATMAIYSAPMLIKSLNPKSITSKITLFACYAVTLFALIYLVVDLGDLYDQLIYDVQQLL